MISRKEHGRLDEKYGLERRREIGVWEAYMKNLGELCTENQVY
ncbi:hypothetical protein T4B_15570 [Trichinella pseudospiralis]|uniref:Uncharacterized protein n=1 Tax=Trichinella pseudospiralis TaxID=6337 RepID=A0A0V1G8H8_TRIPS|nr:hypothetical protein T4B_5757 [Trichinella pseudospiralis]KRY93927.1 hypothetical protein T4B_15570 [Trichinella pseudospiralis]KRY94598.1 hypothetical protein T4C_9588 [Trichinella pseudospiralis]KRY94605.1 hypothetical protein T4C_9760 [Trichinella pseudospiralis]